MKDRILSIKERIGYGMGGTASHITFDSVVLYIVFFYTDIFGIPAGFVGTMFLLVHALDTISDPRMGLLADRTRNRRGKFRPWILFGAIPFGLICVLAYSSPDLSHNGKLIYAAVTYTLLTLPYTVVNTPYCALGGVITDNPTQRVSLQSWRFVLVTAGDMLSTVLMIPLINFIDGEDKALGFQGGIAVLSMVAFLMLAFCFFTTKERIEAPPSITSMREDLRDIWRSNQWQVVDALIILNILVVYVRGSTMMYYTTWIMDLATLLTVFLITYRVGNLIGSALAKPLISWRCKASVFWWTNALLVVLGVAMFSVSMDAEITMLVFIFIIGVLHRLVTPTQQVMMSDTVDYDEWRNGRRLTGISLVGTLFVLKSGLALGDALINWMLAGGGYDTAAKTQNSATLTIIIASLTLVPAVRYLLSAIIAKRYYTLKTLFLKKMMAELAEGTRRNEQDFTAAPIDKKWQN